MAADYFNFLIGMFLMEQVEENTVGESALRRSADFDFVQVITYDLEGVLF